MLRSERRSDASRARAVTSGKEKKKKQKEGKKRKKNIKLQKDGTFFYKEMLREFVKQLSSKETSKIKKIK